MTPELLADAEALLACCPHAERDFVARKLGVSQEQAHDLLTELAREGRIRYVPTWIAKPLKGERA